MNYRLLLVIVVVLTVALFGAYRFRQGAAQTATAPIFVIPPISQREEIAVKKVAVLQGHEFDITLSDDRRIHAILAIQTPPEAKEKVVKFLNHSVKPRCVVLEKNSGAWTIDLIVEQSMMSESAQSLTDWLRQQKLVWE